MTGQKSSLKVPTGAGWWKQHWQVPAVCLVLAAITFAVFGQTAGFGFVNFDDDVYVYENARIASGLGLKSLASILTHADCNLYHPLTMLSLMGDYQIHGLHAGGYHLTNVLLHTASVILLFLVLRQMTGALWRSAFVAAVFAIHPLRVESVAWVAERKDVLSGLFFMLTIGAYVRYARRPWSPARYGLVVLLFALGLMAKPMLVTLPVVLLLLDYWPLRRVESRKLSRLVLEKLPLLALSAVWCVATLLAQNKSIQSSGSFSLPHRLGNALAACIIYLGQMVWPAGLAVLYPYPNMGLPSWEVALAGILLAGFSAVAVWRRRAQPWLLVGWLWYLAMLLPVVGVVQVGTQAHADRYTYLPQIGVYVAVTWLAAEWGAKWRMSRMAIGGLMTVLLGALIICAWKQTVYWHDSETLWAHTIACTTGNYEARSNLGSTLLDKGKVDNAIIQFQEALRIDPRPANIHNNLGIALYQKGRLDESVAEFQKALQLDPDNAKTHNNLGRAFLQKGNAAEAIAHFQQALQLEPSDPWPKMSLAWLLATCSEASLRNGNKAVELATQANDLTGGENPIFLHTLAAAFAEAGRFSEAVETAQRAFHLAETQSKTRLAGQLQSELKLYQAGRAVEIKK